MSETDPSDQTAELLAAWVPQQRWFGGKGRPRRDLTSSVLATLAEQPRVLRLHLVRVTYDDGEVELYQVPLVESEAPVDQLAHALIGETAGRWLYDGPQDKAVTGAWLRLLADRADVGPVGFRRDADEPTLDTSLSSRVLGGEQSNTSLVYGDDLILKLFRKIAVGVNPDIEVHRALYAAGSKHIAEPLGWVEADLPDGAGRGTLAMLQPFLRTATGGWALATASVRDLYAEADLHADEVGGDFASEAERLGQATAEVHVDLAHALPSRQAGPQECEDTAASMVDRLARALSIVAELAPYGDAVRATYTDVATLMVPVQVQRVHGDYHLGQVLRTGSGWVLLDFEGEPARPLAERTALMSPLRDVAGMLRSFDYAARYLLADHPGEMGLVYRAGEWAERNRSAFCDGYTKGSGYDPRDASVLLRAFELDKAVYEVVYEARNRPSWLPIPLGSIQRLVG